MRVLTSLLLFVATASSARDLPNFDAFLDSKASRSVAGTSAFDGHVSSVEKRLGVPTVFWAAQPASGARSFRDQGLTPEQAARRFLFAHAGLYRASPAQLAESAMVGLHDTGHGAIIASFEKRVGGLSVFRDRLNVAMNQQLELIALTGYLSPAALKRGDFKLAAPTAFASAWFDLLGAPIESFRFIEGGLDEAGFRRFTSTLEQPFSGRAKKVLYPLPERLVPAWHLELDVAAPGETSSSMYAFVISAEDGQVLSRKNLVESEQFTYRVWAQNNGLFLPDDGPQGIAASPHPTGTPSGFNPANVLPVLVTLQNSPISTNDAWLAPTATETTGNNVEAYADLASPDGFNAGDLRATTTSTRTFDRTYDLSQQPNASGAQQQAGITQLFFDINQLHDWFYDRGFNEAAGNAQTDNFSRGGAGNDSIKAEAQDFGGTNNANMSTPSDGSRPRMQMFVWTPDVDATLTATPGGAYANGQAAFGATSFMLTANAVLAADAVAPASDGCTALSGSYAGRIVVADRGNCTFGMKALNAQNAGALGIIIVNNAAGSAPALAADVNITTVTIPALSLSQADGTTLKTNLGLGAVTITMSRPLVPRHAGELDNSVVGHEWGHYLSNRLIADATGLSNNQGRAMGEGWGDTVALLLMVREEDLQVSTNPNWAGVYTPAVYATIGPGFLDASYFGIRRYPYSTDFAKNPLTFLHIQNGVALPAGVPRNTGGATNAQVHNSGELWAVTLWECYAALLRAAPRLTFEQARDRMLRYLVAGLKLTPGQPTFTEARDALLAATAAADLADFQLFAAAFARRGLGLGAVSPDRASTTHAGVVETFTTGSDLAFVGATLDDEAQYCDRDGVLDVGERGRLTLTLRNLGVTTLTATTGTLSSPTPGVTFANPTVTFSAAQPFASSTATTQVSLTGITAPQEIVVNLDFNDPQLMSATPRSASVRFRVHSDAVAASSAGDDVETELNAWAFQKDAALSTLFDWRRKTLAPAQHVWFGIDPGATADISLVSPPLLVAGTGSLGMILLHRWDFEADTTTNYDGAVIEVSSNAGTTWTDIGAAAAGYTGTLGGTSSNNPLVGRSAFTGRSPNYPAFVVNTLDLGPSYAGQTVQVRLRIAADQATSGAGWDLEGIAFTGITNTPFPSLVADRGQCINRPPVANAGPDTSVEERSVVTLSSAASTDLDGDALTATWTQLMGPSVTVVGGVFTAPEVTADVVLSFQLVVNDGTVDSTPDVVEVTVRQVNRAPSIPPATMRVDERSVVTLPAFIGVDPDGDALTHSWRQTAGPMVVLSDATAATPQFTAPEVGASSVLLTFELVVSDGSLQSVPAQIDVEVMPLNRAPSLSLNLQATAPERSTVTLEVPGMDADHEGLLRFSSRQLSGPPVTIDWTTTLEAPELGIGSFVAPEVSADAPVTFEVTVSDGTLTASATGTIVITNVNRPPVVVLSEASREVKPGEVVQLDASGSTDPDGEVIDFVWSQTGGAPLAIEGAELAVARFTMPKEGAVTFTVTVKDSAGASAEDSITLTASNAPKGCGCTSGEGLFWLALPLLLARRRRPARR
jgi:large repetitive protein